MWGAIGAGIGSLVNLVQQNKVNKQNMRFQAEQAQLNRDFDAEQAQLNRVFNSDEASKAYDRQKEFWSMQNAYNSPEASMQRLREAGLNPNLIAGGQSGLASGLSPISSAQGSSASYGGGVSPSSQSSRVGDLLENLSVQRQQAEIDNIKAQTRKLGSENEILSTDLKYREAYNQGVLTLQNLNIELTGNKRDLTAEEVNTQRELTTQVQTKVDLINQQITESQANVRYTNSKTLLNDIDAFFRAPRHRAEIDKICSSSQLDRAQLKEIFSLLLLKQNNLRADILLKHGANYLQGLQSKGIMIDLDSNQIDLDIKTEYKDFDAVLERGLNALDGVLSLANIWNSLFGKPKHPKGKKTYTENSYGHWSEQHESYQY